MSKAPAFQLYARDFLVDDTARLSLEATGAYVRLLCHQWINGPLPDDLDLLARLVGTTVDRFRLVWAEIGDRFPVGDDGRRANPELESKRLESIQYRERQAQQGRKGAKVRWLKGSQ